MNIMYEYEFYLNGKLYGGGNLQYMKELFTDYVITCDMYGKPQAECKIVRLSKQGE